MSILIKGIDMPTKGNPITVLIYTDGTAECEAQNKAGIAVPVPPHGRLIDVDALDAYLKTAAIMADGEAKEAYIDARAEARTMEVIIEAEEGE